MNDATKAAMKTMAFPVTHEGWIAPGLTKREYFAAAALAGCGRAAGWEPVVTAMRAVACADALIAVLDEVKP